LLDRIDLHINVQSVSFDGMKDSSAVQSSADLATSVNNAVMAQRNRFGDSEIWNASMSAAHVDAYCVLTDGAQDLIKKAFDRLHLSMRGYHKILKVARTIADLTSAEMIDVPHIQEAILYRSLDQLIERFTP
jgi:magnesium chelatase family protein